MTPALALTMGEPAGIGPDIALTAWAGRQETGCPPFAIICDPDILRARAAGIGLDVALCATDPEDVAQTFANALPILDHSPAKQPDPGRIVAGTAAAVIDSIARGYELARAGRVSALVTNPINKKALYDVGFGFPGHTEYLAHLAGQAAGKPVHPVMLLAGPDLRVAPATIHVPLRLVPDMITTQLIEKTVTVIVADMQARFAIEQPRIVVTGLNPHAGEDGTLGDEEGAQIAPAVANLKRRGYRVRGPLSADTLFHDAARETFDVALTMYHDQALIAAKTLNFHHSVNVTLGLPIIRTSPDHGTALALAGSGKARADSLFAALKLPAAMAQSR